MARPAGEVSAFRLPAWMIHAAIGLGAGVAFAAGLDAASQEGGTAAPAREEEPIPEGEGRVRGVVSYGVDVPLRDIVVYLEPKDTGAEFEAPEEAAVLNQKNAQFWPSLLTVARGQAVEFHNEEEEPIEHNVFSKSEAKEFDIGFNLPGVVKSQRFDKVGEVKIFCSIHRLMEGVIYVCPTRYHAAVGVAVDEKEGAAVRTGGEFRIDAPPGEYVLKTWQKRKRAPDAALPVTVRAGEEARVDVELKRR